MKRFKICVDTNIWMDYIEKRTEAEKSNQLLQSLTDIRTPHTIILPKIAYLEIMYKLIDSRKEGYLITQKRYSTLDFRGVEGKKRKFETELPQKEMKKVESILKDLEISDKIKILSTPIDFSKVEYLIKQGFELLDSTILVQANEEADYFATRDTIARKVNNAKASWIKIKAITIKGMLSLIERSDKK